MRQSLYWDAFAARARETVDAIRHRAPVPVRRVAVFVTGACNLSCKYCNGSTTKTMSERRFDEAVEKYQDAIIHITGGEPGVVPWLYPYIARANRTFHLNTNLVTLPPLEHIARLKVSLDDHDKDRWEMVVGAPVFDRVVENIRAASKQTVLSITCTVTRANIRHLLTFSEFCRDTFPDIYAVFFSIYKGTRPDLVLTKHDADYFWEIRAGLEARLNAESIALMHETLDEKRRLISGLRFPEIVAPCYLCMSERVIDADGEYLCSHLYRDGIKTSGVPVEQCRRGCNRRLVSFNEEVTRQLKARGE